MLRQFNGERIAYSINGARTNIYIQRKNLDIYLILYIKINLKRYIGANTKRVLEESIGEKFSDIELTKDLKNQKSTNLKK